MLPLDYDHKKTRMLRLDYRVLRSLNHLLAFANRRLFTTLYLMDTVTNPNRFKLLIKRNHNTSNTTRFKLHQSNERTGATTGKNFSIQLLNRF